MMIGYVEYGLGPFQRPGKAGVSITCRALNHGVAVVQRTFSSFPSSRLYREEGNDCRALNTRFARVQCFPLIIPGSRAPLIISGSCAPLIILIDDFTNHQWERLPGVEPWLVPRFNVPSQYSTLLRRCRSNIEHLSGSLNTAMPCLTCIIQSFALCKMPKKYFANKDLHS